MSEYAVISIVLVLLVHTGALFRWGGRIGRMLEEHDKEIESLRVSRHEHANIITRVVADLEHLERRLE